MTHAHRAALLLPLLALMSGCGVLSRPLTADDREAVADCNQESDRIFAARNRYQLSELGRPRYAILRQQHAVDAERRAARPV